MSSNFIDYFDVNITILKFAGIWIPENTVNKRTKLWYILYNSLWITYSVIIYTPSEFIILKTSLRDFNDFIKNINMSMTHLLAIIKILIWFTKRNEIINMIRTLKNASSMYESTNDYRPIDIIKKDKIEANRYTKTFLLFASFVSISSLINTLLNMMFTNPSSDVIIFNNITNETIYNYKLSYFSYIPWNYKKSTVIYIITLIYQFFPTFNMAFIIVGFDMLFTTIVSYTSSQLLVLHGAFRTIRVRCLKRLGIDDKSHNVLHNSKQLNDEMTKELKNCIKHLQIIYK